MTKEELDKFPNPWIKVGIRPNTIPFLYGGTEMFLIDHSDKYQGCVANNGYGSHYDLEFLSIDAENGYTIIING